MPLSETLYDFYRLACLGFLAHEPWQQLGRGIDRCERIAQFMRQHGKKLILAPVEHLQPEYGRSLRTLASEK